MARKVFMSVLGVSLYGECIYAKGDFKSSLTRFIQQATLELLMQNGDWTANDKGYILLTQEARKSNWVVENNMRYNSKTEREEKYIGLKEKLDAMHLPFDIEDVDIADGNTETEIWDIFDTVFEKLQEGDELYFDITHGFRYLPMLVVVLGNYAKFLKKIKVKCITYGNFEASYKENNITVAPIVDVTSFSTLQDWTSAVASYLNHGDATALNNCAKNELKPVLREAKGTDEQAKNMKKLCESLKAFTDALRLCRGVSIYEGKDACKVLYYLSSINNDYLTALQPLLKQIAISLKDFKENSAENMILAARMCANFENWQASATFLEEGIISRYCQFGKIKIVRERDLVGNVFEKIVRTKEDYKKSSEEEEKKIDTIIAVNRISKDFAESFCSFKDRRNDINHAGMRQNASSASTLKNCIEKNLLKALETIRKNLFINLSNHPSSTWSAEQLEASKAFGDIVDIVFPVVAPDATPEDINAIADGLVRQIMEKASDNIVTVHVMGEMALTYRLVQRLTSLGIRCVCSTTTRVVKEEGDGKRMVEFHFNQFRDYGE